MLEDKSIYMVFEYAEHDFLVREQPTPHYYHSWLTSLPTASNSSPPTDTQGTNTSGTAEVSHLSAPEWSSLPPFLSHPPSGSKTR